MDAETPLAKVTAAEAVAKDSAAMGRVTPMMEQFIEIKNANPDCLLFYRMGDFYELFFEDAEAASAALGIVLTKRGKHLGEDIPMCGVPVERAEEYLHRLIAAGYRVAVCEQVEDPAEARKRGGKSIVRRDVVRLVTPGTLTEDALLQPGRNNYLVAVAAQAASATDAGDQAMGLAFLDVSTGEFRTRLIRHDELGAELARLEPGEIIISDPLYDDPRLSAFWRSLGGVTPLPRESFDGAAAERRVAEYFGVATSEAFGAFTRLELTAAAACLTYVARTHFGRKPSIAPPQREAAGSTLAIDAATRANLELTRTLSGARKGSLLDAVDCTVTPAGARLLAQRLCAPLTDAEAISARLDAVAAFVAADAPRTEIRRRLKGTPDLARALSRLSLGRGGPRDLTAIRGGLAAAREVAALLAHLPAQPLELARARDALGAAAPALAELLDAALAEELPLNKRDGGFVRAGYDGDLDGERTLRDQSRGFAAALQGRYAEETGIRTLKVRHNNVLGYFIEVSAQHGEKLLAPPLSERFFHRQTMAGQVRFSTAELTELESRIAGAAERALAIELAIFDRLLTAVLDAQHAIIAAAEALAIVDVAAALAELAAAGGYVRPEIEDSVRFCLEGGRHPVVEKAVAKDGGPFVANDCDLSPPAGARDGQIWLLTGPNMAGKSTFLRQNALIVVLAQMGSFVPARRASIGIVDKLFSRVGAADDLARGRSTFMVEMVETAAILNQATARSLVILDEIGRGTATFDGLSIAWATIEHLHGKNRCRALFATHFHELTALSAKLPRLANVTMRVKEWQGDVVFLHEVVPGAADRSYGIQVAKLAGLPASVIERARVVLAELEAKDRSGARGGLEDLPLFSAAFTPAASAEPSPLDTAIASLDPDSLSPREALEALYRLKVLSREGGSGSSR